MVLMHSMKRKVLLLSNHYQREIQQAVCEPTFTVLDKYRRHGYGGLNSRSIAGQHFNDDVRFAPRLFAVCSANLLRILNNQRLRRHGVRSTSSDVPPITWQPLSTIISPKATSSTSLRVIYFVAKKTVSGQLRHVDVVITTGGVARWRNNLN